jgi:DNA-binding transcriptional MerR regulator
MTSGLRIKQVAEASGFTAATLRYYEQIGLLPEASRTPAGYRLYDQCTLDRLAFIARAKQLGCSLEEIAGLTAAWDGGRCGPVQDELRRLVAGKIEATRHQIAELATFAAELQQAAAALERHRPEGACDADCGCTSDSDLASGAPTAQAVSSTDKPIACTLSGGEVQGRVEEWRALLAHVDRREPIDGGVRAVFAGSAPMGELMRLVAAEHECCRFFRFAITVDTCGAALEVRADADADARSIVDVVFGAPS